MKYKHVASILAVTLSLLMVSSCDSSNSYYSSPSSNTSYQSTSSGSSRYSDSSSQSKTNIVGNTRGYLSTLVLIAGNWVKCVGFVSEYDSGVQEWVAAPGYLTCSLYKNGGEVELQPVSVRGKFNYNFITNRQSGDGWYYKVTLWTKDSEVLLSKEGEVR